MVEEKSIIIFAGAGASRGISDDKYPMALDFRKRLTDRIKNSSLYGLLIDHLNKADDVDIEHILWQLGQLSDLCQELTNGKNFAAKLLQTNNINTITSTHHNTGPAILEQFNRFHQIINTLQDDINELVYEYYSKTPTVAELEKSWIPLLKAIASSDFKKIDIVTTNYDLVIESALLRLKELNISMGNTDELLPSVDIELWRNEFNSQGLLTKLHGSVDWKRGNGGTDNTPIIRRGHIEFDGDHKKRLILYPGFKGVPSHEPFIAFHEYFRHLLKQATHIIFIGFAFRDEHINELINTYLPSTSKVAVVNPASDLPKIDVLKDALHIPHGFGLDSKKSLLGNQGMTPFSVKDIESWLK